MICYKIVIVSMHALANNGYREVFRAKLVSVCCGNFLALQLLAKLSLKSAAPEFGSKTVIKSVVNNLRVDRLSNRIKVL